MFWTNITNNGIGEFNRKGNRTKHTALSQYVYRTDSSDKRLVWPLGINNIKEARRLRSNQDRLEMLPLFDSVKLPWMYTAHLHMCSYLCTVHHFSSLYKPWMKIIAVQHELYAIFDVHATQWNEAFQRKTEEKRRWKKWKKEERV